MIEMLGVLAIIGVLSAGGIMGYTTAMTNHKVNKFLEMVRLADSNMLNLFLNKKQAGSRSILADDLCRLNILPADICKTGTGLRRTGYFGETLRPQYYISANSLYPPYFEVYIAGLPQAVCVRLVTHEFWKSCPKATTYQLGSTNYKMPLNMNTAKTACKEQAAKAEGSEFSLKCY